MPIVRGFNESYLLHEFLEPCNTPCYFKEFVARAGAEGLSYLCDAEPSTMFVQNYGEKVREPLLRECGSSQVLMEQYLDFLVNRTFRQSLLVKQARSTGIRYRLDRARLRQLNYAGTFKPISGSFALDASEQTADAIRNLKVTLRQPAHKAVAQLLDACYPATVAADALIEQVASRLNMAATQVVDAVLTVLEDLLIMGAVRIRRSPVRVAAAVSAMPLALGSVRRTPELALAAGASASACNQWHEQMALTLLERSVLPLLDGSHDHEQLATHLEREAQADRLRFMKNDQPITDPAELRGFVREQLALALGGLWRKGLLIA